ATREPRRPSVTRSKTGILPGGSRKATRASGWTTRRSCGLFQHVENAETFLDVHTVNTAALLHPRIETLPPRDLSALQEEKWRRQWDYVRTRSGFYREKLEGAVGSNLTLDAIRSLPLTDKEELRQAQENEPPFGNHLACHPDDINRIHHTSGTTGRALIIANSRPGLEVIARLGARGFYAAGLRPSDRVVHCLNYQMWTGGVTDHMSLEGTGAAVIPYGVGGTRRLIETIRHLGVTAISCTPSYPATLEQVLRDGFGLEPRALGLRLAL